MPRLPTRSTRKSKKMASPQLENGYTSLANEIWDALCRTRIPGEWRQIIDVIIRKTYGFHKKEDAISLSQFCKSTGIKRSNVCRALNGLLERKIIIKKETTSSTIYRFNKDFEEWSVVSKKRHSLQKETRGSLQSDNKPVSKKRHTKERKKVLKKDTSEQSSEDAEIPLLIKSFEELNPAAKRFYGIPVQREACKALIKTYGLERIQKIVKDTLPKTNGLRFFPTIVTPLQLRDKFVILESAIRRYQSEKNASKDKYKVAFKA